MDSMSFFEGPLLWCVLSLLIIGMIVRFAFFIIAVSKKDQHRNPSADRGNDMASIGKVFIPLHKTISKKPLYTLLRYAFHICLIVTPILLAGHVALLEMSSLRISWPTLPDGLADMMTIIFIALVFLFLLRRIIFRDIRNRSSAFDYIFLMLCLLPFLTGYFLAHGILDSIDFFYNNMFYIHILTSCVMIIMVLFLFTGIRFDVKSCIGCGACETNCPTGTLKSVIQGAQKIFSYSNYQCISCGSCMYACPEDAAELRHELSPSKFFQVLGRRVIRSVALKECQKCGALFAPEPQITKLGQTIQKDFYQFCPDCKIANIVDFESDHMLA